MLYNKKNEKFSDELFKNPTAEYRGTPFWAWNCKLDADLLKKEIEYLKEMGFGGFHMHPRVGLATEYLSDEFMHCVEECVEKARSENMLAWLYDEDKWPSGYAGGLNTKDIENRAKKLLFTRIPFDDGSLSVKEDIEIASKYLHEPKYYFEACYDVELDDEGYLVSFKRIDISQKAEHTKWFAYVLYEGDSTWYNGEAYVDTLSKKAMKEFIQITHDRYKEKIGKDFGTIVPAIFTDEPQFSGMGRMADPLTSVNACVAYTPELKDFYKEKYNECIFDVLPEVFMDRADQKSFATRCRYYDAVAELFAQAFADQIGKWCEDNGIYMTGHLMEEPTLQSQTNMVGDAMRSYRGYGIPGIDMLVNNLELTTAKQCQSATHQYGREGMLSELYGVTGWGFDFKGHKYQGDWQAAMGVTVRVPHLAWVSMSGEAKRDYPACIGYQSPWYKEYKYVEDHFARVNTALTRGKPVVNVGVIHPIESYWLACGPNIHTKHIKEDLENCFSSITNWLLDENLDFNYICESTLDDQFSGNENGFGVGCMSYSAVIVPSLLTIRSTTLEKLEDFAKQGGKIIFMGRIPKYVDAVLSDRPMKLAENCTTISWAKDQLILQLEDDRVLSISGRPALYQLRDDGECRYLFMCSKNQLHNLDDDVMCRRHVVIKGIWEADILDTIKGERLPLAVSHKNGNTEFDWTAGAYDSLLLELRNGNNTDGFKFTEKHYSKIEYLQSKVDYTLSEKNVLVLDCPRYSMNGEELSDPEEMLRIDDAIRSRLGIRHRAGAMVQPWITPIDTTPLARVKLVFDIESDIDYEGAQLAMESMEFSKVTFNGQNVPTVKNGYYIDEDSIHTIDLPAIKKGTNTLEIELAFCDACALESYYLLGDFGVQLNGRFAKLVPIADDLAFGAVEYQTLPFYGGNITYHLTYEGELDKVLEVQKFRGSAISVELDGKRVDGMIAYPPHRLHLKADGDGKHTIDITLYGNRANTLNALHNTNQKMGWYGPNAWHPSNNNFSFEYELATNGILTTPRLLSE